MEAKPGAVQDHVQSHIEMIAGHEQDFLESRTRLDRAGDAVGAFAMGLRFVGLHLAAFAAWVLVNTARIGGIAQFDPYPFSLLGTAVDRGAESAYVDRRGGADDQGDSLRD